MSLPLSPDASEDIKAIVRCTGGLRGFLESQSDSFTSDLTNVSCNESRKPSKESDVINWFRGRLKTSPRRIFSVRALEKMVKNGPPGIKSYFAFTCPTAERLQEWFLQRTQIFKETPGGNVTLADCRITAEEDNGLWCCIDFFVKVLDEQGCETLAVDWACLFNYVFVAENPVVMNRIMSMYEETTFENFFRKNAIQFGLEVTDGELCRSADPANSGTEIASSSKRADEKPTRESDAVSLCVGFCKDLLAQKTPMSVLELQKMFNKKLSKKLRECWQNNFAKESFEKFLLDNENTFVLSADRRLVFLRDETQVSDASSDSAASSSADAGVEKVAKYDQLLHDVFRDLLILAGREQGVHYVDAVQLGRCAQFLPKYVASYFSQAYSSPLQFFKDNDTFRFKKNRKHIGLKERAELEGGHSDKDAVATNTMNFFVQALAVLYNHDIKFIPPAQLELLTCFMSSSVKTYIDSNFGSNRSPLKNLLMRFPEFFSESRAGNISLRNPTCGAHPFEPSSEILTNTKAICTYPNEAAALEFYLRALIEMSSQCYPVPLWWCTAKLRDAPRHVISFLEETYPDRNLADFFVKFPAVFCYAPETAAVYLREGPLTDGHNIPTAAATEKLRFEGVEVIFGLVAGLCSASCGPISASFLLQMADKHLILSQVHTAIAESSAHDHPAKLISFLEEFPSIVSVSSNGDTVTLRWPYQLHAELQFCLEQTLCQIIRNAVVSLASEAGLFPAISKVFDHLQSSLDNSFNIFVSTLSDFLEFLDKFKDIFLVNGSTNTIIVKDYSVEVSYAPEVSQTILNGGPVITHGQNPAMLSRGGPSDSNRIRSWIDLRRKMMEQWATLAPLVDSFVRQMDLNTVTRFSALHALGDGLSSVLKEIERLMKVNAIESVTQMMGLYWEKNTVFFCELVVTINSVASFILKDRTCSSANCGCRRPLKFHKFEDFVDFCLSIRSHLEQGPYPGVLTPSSSGSKSSTPEIFDSKCGFSPSCLVCLI